MVARARRAKPGEVNDTHPWAGESMLSFRGPVVGAPSDPNQRLTLSEAYRLYALTGRMLNSSCRRGRDDVSGFPFYVSLSRAMILATVCEASRMASNNVNRQVLTTLAGLRASAAIRTQMQSDMEMRGHRAYEIF